MFGLLLSMLLQSPEVPERPAVAVLMAAVPSGWLPAEPPPERVEVHRMTHLNPGREEAVRAILDRYGACLHPIEVAATLVSIRQAARGLDETTLTALAAFYNSPDLARFDRLRMLMETGAKLTEGELADWRRLFADWPLRAFLGALRTAEREAEQEPARLAQRAQCAMQRRAEFESQGLRSK